LWCRLFLHCKQYTDISMPTIPSDVVLETTHTHIWTTNFAQVGIIIGGTTTNGITTGGSAKYFAFIEGVTVGGVCRVERRPVLGRSRKMVVCSEPFEYNCSIEAIYLDKTLELQLSNFFTTRPTDGTTDPTPVTFEFSLIDPGDGSDDVHTLANAYATRFEVTGRDNQNVIVTAEFTAESFV
jgi:hypothetical protein